MRFLNQCVSVALACSFVRTRQRPFCTDGGRCRKGVPSSGEKLVVLPTALQTPSAKVQELRAAPYSWSGGICIGGRPATPPRRGPPVCTVKSEGTANKLAEGSLLWMFVTV